MIIPNFNTPITLFAVSVWMAGVVLASGFWSTLFSICVPLWAFYLVVEKVLQIMGWV